MNKNLLKLLRCPVTGQELKLEKAIYVDEKIKEGVLITMDNNKQYLIINFIPRFVPESNYADNFGVQWNLFSKTQLDSFSGHKISENRFWLSNGLSPKDLDGKWVLDCGCGAGRFAEIALKAGANLVAIDFSNAVDACYRNLNIYPNLYLVQANIYELPFLKNSFDLVYSLGVLQHTPDVKKAFLNLPEMLLPGGQLCVDFYEDTLKSKFLPKFWLRPITKRLNSKKLFIFLQNVTPGLLKISIFLSCIPILGNLLKRLVPVANYKGILPLDDTQLKEWALLDTFDWLAPEYDNPQTEITVSKWFKIINFDNIEVFKKGHLIGRANKKV